MPTVRLITENREEKLIRIRVTPVQVILMEIAANETHTIQRMS